MRTGPRACARAYTTGAPASEDIGGRTRQRCTLVRDIRRPPEQHGSATFTEVAVEYFIYPLLNRFWLFFRDEQTREERTAQYDLLHRYRGAGTGLILNAVVLSHFLSTLGSWCMRAGTLRHGLRSSRLTHWTCRDDRYQAGVPNAR